MREWYEWESGRCGCGDGDEDGDRENGEIVRALQKGSPSWEFENVKWIAD